MGRRDGHRPAPPAVITQNPRVRQADHESKRLGTSRKLWPPHVHCGGEHRWGGNPVRSYPAPSISPWWDIIGKKAECFRCTSCSAARRETRFRIYTSYRWGNIPRTREAYATRTKELIAQRRYLPVNTILSGPILGLTAPASPHPILNEVRRDDPGNSRSGDQPLDICVECHGKWNLASAGRIIRMLEPFDPFFIEEPVPPENTDAMAMLQRSTNMPIATGRRPADSLQLLCNPGKNRPPGFLQTGPVPYGGNYGFQENRRHGGCSLRDHSSS